MKRFKFVAFLFFRYYSKGATSAIPYFSTITAIGMLLYFHLFQLLIVTKKVDALIHIKPFDNQITKRLVMFCVIAPLILVPVLLIKKSELKAMDYPPDKIKAGGILLVVYIVGSFALLMILAFTIKT